MSRYLLIATAAAMLLCRDLQRLPWLLTASCLLGLLRLREESAVATSKAIRPSTIRVLKRYRQQKRDVRCAQHTREGV